MQNIQQYNEKVFEQIKHIANDGTEYWFARELQQLLEYTKWSNFENVIQKAKTACENAKKPIAMNFTDISKIVKLPLGEREINDYALSRYACYLIVMNADSNKEVIAFGQTYFATKTRQQELIDNYQELSENQKRVAIREEMIEHNKSLAEAAKNAGVTNYGLFQNYGYRGLYNGMTASDIKEKKGLSKNQNPLDYMGVTELAANLFRATQTDEKLRREQITGAQKANKTHYEVGKKVRQTIEELGGTMPEDLPTPEKSVKQIKKELSKLEQKKL